MSSSAATGSTTTRQQLVCWDDVMDAIEFTIEPYDLPWERGSERGVERRYDVTPATRSVYVEHDAGEDLPTRSTFRKELVVGGQALEVVVALTLVSAVRSRDGRSVLTRYAVEPFGLREDLPPVVTGPGGRYRRAPLGGSVDIVG